MGKTAPRTYCPIDAELVEQFSEAVTNYFGAVSDLSAITAGTRSGGSLFYKPIGQLGESMGTVNALARH